MPIGTEVLAQGLLAISTASDFIAFPLTKQIGDIGIDVMVEETHASELHTTEHPIETGALITDHSFMRPLEVVLRCGWSNSNFRVPVGSLVLDPGVPGKDYVTQVYSQLLALQKARKPFSILTTLRQYPNMLMTSLEVSRDQRTSQVLVVSASCREVIIVNTKSTSLPPKENQANPASTAETKNAGTKQLVPGQPSPGGAVTPDNW